MDLWKEVCSSEYRPTKDYHEEMEGDLKCSAKVFHALK
jgi:hypothetical protein